MPLIFQPSSQRFRWYRPREIETPKLVTGAPAQELDLLLVLDAFGDDLEPEIVPQRNARSNDRSVVGIDTDVLHERPIDFEAIDRKTLHVAQARVSRAEIVDGDLHA